MGTVPWTGSLNTWRSTRNQRPGGASPQSSGERFPDSRTSVHSDRLTSLTQSLGRKMREGTVACRDLHPGIYKVEGHFEPSTLFSRVSRDADLSARGSLSFSFTRPNELQRNDSDLEITGAWWDHRDPPVDPRLHF
ncbi:hypothetical protein EYF80_065464 [Liparis tanakae]|uniref:Uncharacterized protein n=1 Tax=Liparis tanakae TaxID=230148 RepID=A0A4Z2E6M8_9TELE|nr:hypothetical protein EYF80_065464 [Liparis tanakae]